MADKFVRNRRNPEQFSDRHKGRLYSFWYIKREDENTAHTGIVEFDDDKGKFLIYQRPKGYTGMPLFIDAPMVAGPFETLEAAKTAYLLIKTENN